MSRASNNDVLTIVFGGKAEILLRKVSKRDLLHIAKELLRVFDREAIPTVVDAPLPGLQNRSIFEVLMSDGIEPIMRLLDRFGSYIP